MFWGLSGQIIIIFKDCIVYSKQFFHDKMNTALPKHSIAVKKTIKSFSIVEGA